jgi:hypothetical protein
MYKLTKRLKILEEWKYIFRSSLLL